MLSLFRSAKVILICQTICKCKDASQQLISLSQEIHEETPNLSVCSVHPLISPVSITKSQVLTQLIQSKPCLSDESLDHLVTFATQNVTTNINNDKTNNKVDNNSQSMVEQLPQDVFKTVGSYLCLKSTINLSLTSNFYNDSQ